MMVDAPATISELGAAAPPVRPPALHKLLRVPEGSDHRRRAVRRRAARGQPPPSSASPAASARPGLGEEDLAPEQLLLTEVAAHRLGALQVQHQPAAGVLPGAPQLLVAHRLPGEAAELGDRRAQGGAGAPGSQPR